MTAIPGDLTTRLRLPRPSRWWLLLVAAVVWVLGWVFFQGTSTLFLAVADLGGWGFHAALNDFRDSVNQALIDNPVMKFVFGGIRDGLNGLIGALQPLFSEPDFPRPVPEVGWLGVVAIAAWVSYAIAGVRSMVLVVVSFLLFGFLGYWRDSIDLLIVTLVVVAIAVVIGIPLGVWMGRSTKVTAVLTPVLDVMQTMPSFCYLLPVVLLFSIGPAAAVVATLIYALPPVVRVTAHGLRNVNVETIEASTSMGSTKGQVLRKIQLPMAKQTIIVGVNQTTMAALSMATIAALVDGPGLGQPVVEALASLDVGNAFVAGLAIVIMAVMLDRTTTAASRRAEASSRSRSLHPRLHQLVLLAGAIGAVVLVYISHLYEWAARFPSNPDLGSPVARWVQSASDFVLSHLSGVTDGIKNAISYGLLNPLQSLLADQPWYLVGLVILIVSAALGGWRAVVTSGVCIGLIIATGLWYDSMVTLTMTLVATILVVILGVVFGVWMGRSNRVDAILRPILDAAQTIPPFVYLVPVVGLFQPTRFTAIVAATVYAAPVAIKLVAEGIRGVSPTAIEAAQATGSTSWQMITKVQLPMARRSVALAINQGLLYVLSMVVIGALVGAGALGYDVVSGFSQENLFGKGFAAGIAIVLLGIMLDRVTQRAAAGGDRQGASVGKRRRAPRLLARTA